MLDVRRRPARAGRRRGRRRARRRPGVRRGGRSRARDGAGAAAGARPPSPPCRPRAAISLTDAGPACRRARIRSRLGADSAWMLSAAARANASSARTARGRGPLIAGGHERRTIPEGSPGGSCSECSALGGADGLLDVAVPVGRTRRARTPAAAASCGRVQPALELAEDDAEQEVAPGRLGERAPVAGERGQLVARRVALVDERASAARSRGARRGPAAGPRAHDGQRQRAARRSRRAAPNSAPLARCSATPTAGQARPRVTALPSSSVSS